MSPFEEAIEIAAREYTARRRIALAACLGAGNNGTVWSTTGRTALKIHRLNEPFEREVAAYDRLAGAQVIAGHSIPSVVAVDRSLLAIEMTIVEPPFVLDLASAYPVASAPEFPPEIMHEWLEDKREQFGSNWPRAASIVRAFERDFGLRLLDVHPGNIRFADV